MPQIPEETCSLNRSYRLVTPSKAITNAHLKKSRYVCIHALCRDLALSRFTFFLDESTPLYNVRKSMRSSTMVTFSNFWLSVRSLVYSRSLNALVRFDTVAH